MIYVQPHDEENARRRRDLTYEAFTKAGGERGLAETIAHGELRKE